MDKPYECEETFNGFTLRTYNETQADRDAWLEICKTGKLLDYEEDAFERYITSQKGYSKDLTFFVLDGEKPIATITILDKGETNRVIMTEEKLGYVHMVGVHADYCGHGLGGWLNRIALAALSRMGCQGAWLTTDDWRLPAIRSYLRYGFRPVLYDDDMEERWTKVLTEQGYTNVLCTDANFKAQKLLCEDNTNKPRIGIFGAYRGSDLAHAITISNKGWICAVCDANTERLEDVKKYCSKDTQYFTDFDEFIETPMDAVVLCNYFCDHAEYAIRAMKKGIHVASETLPATTMQECVELCRTVEETGCIYMLEENFAYFPSVMKLQEEYKHGDLGEVVYMEGEYVHPMSAYEYALFTPTATHWRALMPSGYYLTHSLAPLMCVTGTMPKTVNARSIYTDAVRVEREDEIVKDVASIMLCGMDNGALARITGWAKFGGHGSWYRFSCAKGCAETVRGNEFSIQITPNSHGSVIRECETPFPYDAELARVFWHNGGDYYVMLDFIDCIANKKQPFLDVYRAAAMTAVGILGWRSALNNGAEYVIPDFRNEDERKVFENDNLSPFIDANGERNYPCTIYEKEQFGM